jgi:transposase
MWVPPETADPVCLHAPTRKSISYFGAVRLRDGKLVTSRPEDRFNAQTCQAFFRRLDTASRRAGRKVVVIIDNAKYHHATLHAPWRQTVSDHFVLHFLPPYSPELNPIERVWKLVRRLGLHNRYFPKLEDVVMAVSPIFLTWARPNRTLAHLCGLA